MSSQDNLRRSYSLLLSLYPRPYQGRFKESMEQTFSDLIGERTGKSNLYSYALWLFLETAIGIIQENMRTLIMNNKRLIGILTFVTLLLLTPLIAMQFTSEVDWSGSDFLIMGILLFGTGILIEVALRESRHRRL